MSYTPVYENMHDSIIPAAQKIVGWGGIEFLYFLVALVILIFIWKAYKGM